MHWYCSKKVDKLYKLEHHRQYFYKHQRSLRVHKSVEIISANFGQNLHIFNNILILSLPSIHSLSFESPFCCLKIEIYQILYILWIIALSVSHNFLFDELPNLFTWFFIIFQIYLFRYKKKVLFNLINHEKITLPHRSLGL